METDNTAQTQSAPTSHLPVHHAYRTCGTTTTTTVDSSSQRVLRSRRLGVRDRVASSGLDRR